MARVSIYAFGASLAAMALSGAAQAQTSDGDREASSDIVVTAQKREQSVVDVPMALTVLGGQELDRKGVASVQDLSFNVPGLTMREDGPGTYTIFLRGLANQSGSGALVGQYLDEVPLTLSGFDQLSPAMLDLARVEVLKGPQGTLYGQGSAGGIIRYITNKPRLDRVEGRIEGEIYDVDSGDVGQRTAATLNIPIVTDTLALRVAGSYASGGGWIDQPEAGIKNGNGTRTLEVRGTLLWQATDRLSATAMVDVHRAKTKLGLGFEEPDRTVDVGIDRSLVLAPKKFDYTLYNLTLDYDLGFASLVSATSYSDFDHHYPFTYIPREGNFSYGYVEGNDDRQVNSHQFSQEVRLTSDTGSFHWTIGGYYASNRRKMETNYEYLYSATGGLYSGNDAVLYDNLYNLTQSTSKSISLFGDVSYDLTDTLTAGGGLRYFHDRQTYLNTYVRGAGSWQRASFESSDPRFYLSWKYLPTTSLYASFGKGFRSGGFNSAPFAPYDPEKILTYEVGTKGQLADGVVQFDLAGFYTNYKDMVRRRLTFVDGASLMESSNIGRVEVKGVELGLALHPYAGLTLTGNLAYLHSEIVATSATDTVNVVGDRTDYTPPWSFTLGGSYDFNWAAGVPGFVRADFSYRDAVTYIDRSSFLASALPQRSDSLSLLGARIGATVQGFDVEIYGQNLLNQNRSIDPYQGWANANRTRPRVIGMKLGRSF